MLSDSVFKFQKRVADAEFFSALKKEFKDLDTFIKENEATFNDIADAIGFVLTGALKLLSTGIKALAKAVDTVTIAYEHLISAVNFVLPKQLEIQIKTKEQRELERQIGEIEKERFLRLKGILQEQNKITKSLNAQKESIVDIKKVEEAIAKAKEKERTKELFILSEINKKRLKFHELETEGVKQFGKQRDILGQVGEKIKENNESFSLSNEIFNSITSFTSSFSRSLAEAIVLGKSINKSFKELAQGLLIDILAKTIERLALLAIEEFIVKKIIGKDNEKLRTEKAITKEKQKQVALQALLLALGGGGGGGFILFNKGGSVRKNQPVIVGDSASGKGGELFVPNSSGQIIPNSRLGSMGGAVNVNFNISTVDASGFEELLVRSRGTITQLINNTVNEKGRSSII